MLLCWYICMHSDACTLKRRSQRSETSKWDSPDLQDPGCIVELPNLEVLGIEDLSGTLAPLGMRCRARQYASFLSIMAVQMLANCCSCSVCTHGPQFQLLIRQIVNSIGKHELEFFCVILSS